MGRGEGERRSLPQVPRRVEEGRGSQEWWRGEGVNLLGDKKNRKCAVEPIVVNSEETTEMSRYLNHAISSL